MYCKCDSVEWLHSARVCAKCSSLLIVEHSNRHKLIGGQHTESKSPCCVCGLGTTLVISLSKPE